MLVFEERGKPEYLEKNLSKQGRESTTNSTHIWRQRWDLLFSIRSHSIFALSETPWVSKVVGENEFDIK